MVRDAVDAMLRELRRIRQAVAQEARQGEPELNLYKGMQTLSAGNYLVRETADMDESKPNGTRELEPGEDVALARLQSDAGVGCLAVGATDASDVTFYLYADNSTTIGGTTRSPLGTIGSPYSFVSDLNGIVAANHKLEYRAQYDSSATGTVELNARIHGVVDS